MSIYIKKSIYDILSKSLNMSVKGNKAKLEKLKAAVIAILEKKEKADDKEEVKKAALYFAKDEYRYSYLEKSVNGEWIEKAGYGVGTVRIWKGKKYKKVATNPVKWVRVFDKHTRGAASSMGRYIAQVKRCNSVDELYQFCMKQRSLFQDENGVDLPIMDKLRAAIDEQGGKIERGEINTNNSADKKGVSKEDSQNQLLKITEEKQKNLKKIKDLYDEMNKLKESKALSKNKVKIIKIEKNGYVRQENDSDLDLVQNFKERVKQLNYPIVFDDYGNGISHLWITVPEDEVNDVKSKLSHKSIKVYEETEKHFNDDYEGFTDYEDLLDKGYNKLKPKYNKLENDTELKNLQKEINDLEDKNYQLEKDGNELLKEISNIENNKKESEKSRNPFNMKDMSYSITVRNGIEEYKKQKKIMNWDLENEKKKIEKEYDFSDMSEEKKNNFLKPKFENLENQFKAAKDNVEYIKKMLVQFSDKDGVNNIISKMKNAGIYEEVMGKSNKEPESKEKTFELEKEDFQNAETMSEKFKLLGLKKGQKVEYDGETYTVDAIAGTNHDKGKFQMSILQWDAQGNISKRKYITALNFDKVKPIENKESEQEKHQNRSDAMKGNQNAYKGKPIEKAIEKYANDKKLKSTVDKISSADFVSTDLRKYFMNGIYHEDGYDIATDGRILSMMKSDYSKDDEGEITVTDKLLKIAEKELKKLNKELLLAEAKLKEAKKEAKQKGRGSNYYLEFENNVRKIKEEIDTIEKEKETGHIAGHFPAYKRVIPSLGNSKLDNIKGFEDFDNILRVAKVAAAYIKEKDDNNTVVKVGDKYFKPELLEKVVAMAKKYGLNEILSDSERENGPVEFKGENGSVVLMPLQGDQYNTFDVQTGNYSSLNDDTQKQMDDFVNVTSEKKSELKKALLSVINLLDDDDEDKEYDDVLFDYDETDLSDEDYKDYDASQPELFNSISYKVGNVLDDLYCC